MPGIDTGTDLDPANWCGSDPIRINNTAENPHQLEYTLLTDAFIFKGDEFNKFSIRHSHDNKNSMNEANYLDSHDANGVRSIRLAHKSQCPHYRGLHFASATIWRLNLSLLSFAGKMFTAWSLIPVDHGNKILLRYMTSTVSAGTSLPAVLEETDFFQTHDNKTY